MSDFYSPGTGHCVSETQRGTHSDPMIGEVFELLHRMESCQINDAYRWMARDAIRKPVEYERSARSADVAHSGGAT
ncbi:MAG: hypothetical protein VB141_13425 [Burkholderia gladioli]